MNDEEKAKLRSLGFVFDYVPKELAIVICRCVYCNYVFSASTIDEAHEYAKHKCNAHCNIRRQNERL